MIGGEQGQDVRSGDTDTGRGGGGGAGVRSRMVSSERGWDGAVRRHGTVSGMPRLERRAVGAEDGRRAGPHDATTRLRRRGHPRRQRIGSLEEDAAPETGGALRRPSFQMDDQTPLRRCARAIWLHHALRYGARVNQVRRRFLEAYASCGRLLASPRLAARWEEESALRAFSVKGLVGHLVRAGEAVLEYLARGQPQAEPIEGPDYYATLMITMDDDDAHAEVRARGEANAAGGPETLLAKHERACVRLEETLEQEAEDRLVQVYGGLVMRLDDYVITRLVEVLVHSDDLAVSLGLEPPALGPETMGIAIHHLVEVARRARGDRAVLIALTRRERDAEQALRVF